MVQQNPPTIHEANLATFTSSKPDLHVIEEKRNINRGQVVFNDSYIDANINGLMNRQQQ